MKTRNGFVSNSSSASFICYWRDLNYDKDDNTLQESLKKLVDAWDTESIHSLVSEILRQTEETHTPGTFKTDMWTSMYNDITDTPQSMALLVAALVAKKSEGFELITYTMDRE